MNHEQLIGRYVRLKDELAKVQDGATQSKAWTDRLGRDVAATAREIVTQQPADEQVSEPAWAVLLAPNSTSKEA